MEGGCRVLYLGPELPPELIDLRGLTWARAVTIIPLEDGLSLAADLITSRAYDCVAFASPRGPGLLRRFMNEWPPGVKPLCVGSGTSRAFSIAFGRPCETPREFSTRGLAELAISEGCRSLLTLRSEQGDHELEDIASRRMNVRRVDIYAERPVELNVEGRFDVLIASSPLIARIACAKLKGQVGLVIAMGVKTERALRETCPDVKVLAPHEHSFKAVRQLLATLGCA
ncbi:MAG: uroporphyrinogen-III synthase [Acidilobus sp.]